MERPPEASEDEINAARQAVESFMTMAFVVSRVNLLDPNVILALSNLSTHVRMEPLPNGRRDSTGRSLDWVAPSVWHASAFLLLDWASTRYVQHLYQSKEAAEGFGSHRLYRGQTNPWSIKPSAFRSGAIRALGHAPLEAFCHFLRQHLPKQFAPGLGEFVSLASVDGAASLAQHYGWPTHLIDLTFHPIVAIHFACLKSERDTLLDHPLQGYGVVYVTSFDTMHAVASPDRVRIHNELPFPLLMKRWYQQCSIHISCGSAMDFSDDSKAITRQEQAWNYFSRQCNAIYFPRKYPNAGEAMELLSADKMMLWVNPGSDASFSSESKTARRVWYAPAPFVEAAIFALHAYCQQVGDSFERDAAVDTMSRACRGQTLWPQSAFEMPPMKVLDEMLRHVTEYLFQAASIHTIDEIHFDPRVLIPIAQANSYLFGVIRTAAEDLEPQGLMTRGLGTFSEMIAEAADRWNGLLAEARGQREAR